MVDELGLNIFYTGEVCRQGTVFLASFCGTMQLIAELCPRELPYVLSKVCIALLITCAPSIRYLLFFKIIRITSIFNITTHYHSQTLLLTYTVKTTFQSIKYFAQCTTFMKALSPNLMQSIAPMTIPS